MSNKTTLIQTDLPKLCLSEKSDAKNPTEAATEDAPDQSTAAASSVKTPESKPETKAEPMTSFQDNSKAKWNYLKKDLRSAVSEWSDLEAKPKKKTAEEEQMKKCEACFQI